MALGEWAQLGKNKLQLKLGRKGGVLFDFPPSNFQENENTEKENSKYPILKVILNTTYFFESNADRSK